MLFVPYSSIIAMIFWRRPVSSDAIEIAVITPITIPSTVRKLRNLWPRTLSIAIFSVSRKIPLGSRSFITNSPLRLCQCQNGIESSSLKGRVNARNHADDRRDGQCQDDVANGYRHRDRSERGDQSRDGPRRQQADDATEPAKNSRFNQKLHQDLSSCGADCFSEPHFEGAFRHADQHDVHYHDAAHDEGNESNRNDDFRDRTGELVDLIVQLFNVHETKIVFFVSVKAMLDSHGHACVFDRTVKILAIATLTVNLQTVAAEDLKMRGYGNVDLAVKGVAENCAPLFFNAHDAHRQPANFECLPNWILVWEKLFLDIAAEHNYKRRAPYFVVGDEASELDSFVFDINHVGSDTEDLRADKLNAVLPQVRAGTHARTDFRAGRTMVADPLVVVPIKSLVASISSLKLVVVHVAGEGHAGDHEVVAAQDFSDFFDDVRVEAADGGSDCHDRGDADDDADQRQKGPQFVGKDRLHGDL